MKTNHKVTYILFRLLTCALIIGFLALAATPAGAEDALKQQLLVDEARITLNDFVADPNMAWLKTYLKDSKGVFIVPSLVKGGFVWGGSGGRGILVARDEKTGEWSQPVFYGMGSVSWGLQIGIEKSQVILLIRTNRGIEGLYGSSFKIGGDVSIAVGPVGVGAAAKSVTGDLVSFFRSKGAFAGMSLEGSVIKVNDEWNSAYYGKAVRPVNIIIKKEVTNPKSAKLRETLAKIAGGGK